MESLPFNKFERRIVKLNICAGKMDNFKIIDQSDNSLKLLSLWGKHE